MLLSEGCILHALYTSVTSLGWQSQQLPELTSVTVPGSITVFSIVTIIVIVMIVIVRREELKNEMGALEMIEEARGKCTFL